MKNHVKFLTLWLVSGVMANVYAADSLYVDETGKVGIGTSSPAKKLQVEGVNDAVISVKNTATTGAERTMFILSNKGKTRFQIANGAHSWTFDNAGNRFQISKVGSGPPAELSVYDNGDGHFGGNVYADQVLLTSSSESKTDFAPVNVEEVLEQLGSLEIQSWRYKDEDESDRHIGPVAEDFQDVFKLGDGAHISAVDFGGIAFAAIQGLHEGAREQAVEVASLREENMRLMKANAALEKRLQTLENLVLQGK